MNRLLLSLAFLAAIALQSLPAHAQGDAETEAKFIAMLKNATLKGTWAPVAKGKLGGERDNDTYKIARVEKKDDGKWAVVVPITLGDRTIEYPIPCSVKFAGDTGILILDNVRTGQGSAQWSARVMFHDDVYAGRWWETANKEHGGTINGTITRGDAKPDAKPAEPKKD